MMTLTQLEYIVAVDTHRHFGKAAEHCFITQPTLSMQIKKLEEDLEVVIFDRSRQPLIPTEIGTRIIEQARLILREAEKVDYLVKDHKNLISGELNIGIIPTLAPYLLPLFIGNYKRNYPNIKLKIEELTTAGIINHLNRGLLDVGILVTPLNEERISERHLFYEEMMVYLNKDHRLSKKDQIKVTDISTPDLWLLSDGHCFRHQIINLCSSKGDNEGQLPFAFEAGSLETIIKIIDIEGGLTILPELAVRDLPEERRHNIRHFENMAPLREISLAYMPHCAKRKIIELMGKEIINSIPEKLLSKSRGTVVTWKE